MTDPRWPQIGPEELQRLWELYAPRFIKLDDVEKELPQMREQFLVWLEETGVDLAGFSLEQRARIGRVKLDQVGLTRRDGTAEAFVSMSFAGASAEARRIGSPLPDEVLRLAATATLDAVHELVPQFDFGLEKIFTIESSPPGDGIAISVVRDVARADVAKLVGACSVVTSPPEAAVRATLDAINRPLERAQA